MICLFGNLPALQVGHQQVAGYGTDWIDESLRRAASASNRQDFPFIDEIRDGILHYLENRCPLRVFSLEDLFERMRVMLRKIGCDAIADHLSPLAPPISFSLVRAAREAGNGYELVFFKFLTEEINLLKMSGAEAIRFCDIEEGVMILRGAKKMTKDCVQLAAEVVAFLKRFDQQATSRDRNFRFTVEP